MRVYPLQRPNVFLIHVVLMGTMMVLMQLFLMILIHIVILNEFHWKSLLVNQTHLDLSLILLTLEVVVDLLWQPLILDLFMHIGFRRAFNNGWWLLQTFFLFKVDSRIKDVTLLSVSGVVVYLFWLPIHLRICIRTL